MAWYLLKCLKTPLGEIGTHPVAVSYDFKADDDLKAVAIAAEYFSAEIGAAPYAELFRDPASPKTASVRVWQEGL
jgi:hypothetical protein